jgi:hypothetical protein
LARGEQPGTPGRPRGVSEQRQELQLQLHRDLAQLGYPYKPDLYSFLVKNLPDPDWRKEYQLELLEVQTIATRIRHLTGANILAKNTAASTFVANQKN